MGALVVVFVIVFVVVFVIVLVVVFVIVLVVVFVLVVFVIVFVVLFLFLLLFLFLFPRCFGSGDIFRRSGNTHRTGFVERRFERTLRYLERPIGREFAFGQWLKVTGRHEIGPLP